MLTSDNELLGLYVNGNDDRAFEQLIQRHAPMVMGVCRSVLWQAEDVEDAFQAVFLLLSQKAHKLTQHNSVGGWLHETAFRTCLKLRKRISRVREVKMEHEPAQAHEPWQLISESRDCELLHKEIMRLPKKYRDVIVLCHLEGKSRSQAAAVLDCTTASVKAALARGRQLLRRRLIKHGIAASVVLGTFSMTQVSLAANATGTVSGTTAVAQNLIQSTMEICAASKSGGGLGAKAAYIQSLIQKEAFMNFNLTGASLTTATCTLLFCIICSLSFAVGDAPKTRATIYLQNVNATEAANTEINVAQQEDDEQKDEIEAPQRPRVGPIAPNVIRVANEAIRKNTKFNPARNEGESASDYAERLYDNGLLSDDDFDRWLAGQSLDIQRQIGFTSYDKREERKRTVTRMTQVERVDTNGDTVTVMEPREEEQTYFEAVPTEEVREFSIQIGNSDQVVSDADSGFELTDGSDIGKSWVFPSDQNQISKDLSLPIDEQIANWKSETTKKQTESWEQYVERLYESGFISRSDRRKWQKGKSIKIQQEYFFVQQIQESRSRTITVMESVEETDQDGNTVQKMVPRQVEQNFEVLRPKTETREGLFGIPAQGQKPDTASNSGFLFRQK